MTLVSSLIPKVRKGVLSWIMVICGGSHRRHGAREGPPQLGPAVHRFGRLWMAN